MSSGQQLAFPSNTAASVTFADRGENEPGMQILGKSTNRVVTVDMLKAMKMQFELGERDGVCQLGVAEMYELNDKLGKDPPPTDRAAVLVLRNFADVVMGEGTKERLMHEIESMRQAGKTDTQALMRGAVKNKNARHNNVIAWTRQEPDISKGKGTVVHFEDYPSLKKLHAILACWQQQDQPLIAELNYYFDVKTCGIGFHGDRERSLVAGLRLGKATEQMPLMFQGYHYGAPIGEMTTIPMNHGDVYFMSHKAIGSDWLCQSRVTWRHAAGSDTCTYSKLKKVNDETAESRRLKGAISKRKPIVRKSPFLK